jgi:hypothetical protein
MPRSAQNSSIASLWPKGLHSIWLTAGVSPVALLECRDLPRGVVAHADVFGETVLPRAYEPLPQLDARAVVRWAMNEHEIGVLES